MKCLCCGQNIGLVRRLAGSRFCCDGHRKRYGSHSARALRDVEDRYGDDEWASNAIWRSTRLTSREKQKTGADQKTTILGLLAAAFLVMALIAGAESGGSSARPQAANYSIPGPATGHTGGGGLSRLFGAGSVALRDDFRSGLSNWIADRSNRGWSYAGGYVKPGGLRLWKGSTTMSDYEFEFVGQIHRQSMSWAFRAPDVRNYYASKLTISGPASQPNAGLVRFIVLGGRECERVELPLPISLTRGTDYRINMSVRGSRFLTSVNGQLVSSWSDSRIGRGGVGFFSEDGDLAAVKWATVTERDGILGRLASYFSLLTFPSAAVAAP